MMSARNGDKARFGAQRKRKAAQRIKIRALREELKKPAEAPQEEHHGALNSAAEAIGSALGSLAAKAKQLTHHEPAPAQE